MSRQAPRPLSAAIGERSAALVPRTTLARAQEAWPRVAGAAIAAAAVPTAERDGVLTITCEASVWAQELDLMGEELVAGLNAALGDAAITRLRCRTSQPLR